MADEYHYPPDLFDLLVDALGRLNKSKKGVVLFLRGAGVDETDLAEVDRTVRASPDAINKFEIARNVLIKVNARGDSGLRPRREIIKRVVEFEDFSNCWPEDQLKARGLVAAIREAVNRKDSFTRMKQERDAGAGTGPRSAACRTSGGGSEACQNRTSDHGAVGIVRHGCQAAGARKVA